MSAVIISYQPLQINFNNENVSLHRVLTLPFQVTDVQTVVVRYNFVTNSNETYYVLQGFRGNTPTIFIYNNTGILQQAIQIQTEQNIQTKMKPSNRRVQQNYIPNELTAFINSLESRFALEIQGNIARGFSSTKVNKSLSEDS